VTSATTPQGTCSSSSCTLGAIDVGSQAQIAFTLQATAAGNVAFSATATPTPPDLNPGNNSVTLNETVTDFTVSSSPPSVSVTAGNPANFQVTLAPAGGPFNNQISLACTGAAEGMNCSAPAGPYILSGSTVTETVTITTTAPQATQRAAIRLRHILSVFALCLGIVLIGSRHRTRMMMVLFILPIGFLLLNACGGGSGAGGGGGGGGGGTPPGTYNFTVTASSGTNQQTATLTVVVQ